MAKKRVNPDVGYSEALKRIETCRKSREKGTALDLRRLGLTVLPSEIGDLTALTHLDANENELTELPPEIGSLVALAELHVRNNRIATLPPEIGSLSALKNLNFTYNQLTVLPSEIGDLKGLTTLGVVGNKLVTLPPEVACLNGLKELFVWENHLAELPKEIGDLKALTFLVAKNNHFTTLPPEIGRLTALTRLNVSGNQLTALPLEIGRLAALIELNVNGNQLIALPPEIGRLTALRELYVCDNQLTALPPEIGRLTALRELFVSGNQLTALPLEIGGLRELTDLNVSGNHLTTLPPEIGGLTKLRELNVTSNRLTALPAEFGGLTALTHIYLHENPGLGLPIEVLGPTSSEVRARDGLKAKPASEILASYFRIVGEAGEALGECKIIVVGRGQAGKTSLVKRLRGKVYDPKEPETHGISIQKLAFDGSRGRVTARVWDFGGQVVLHSMHEFFLTARSLYLLVLGERDDMLERDAAYWLQLIRSYAGKVPVVVALNKSAGRKRQFDRETLERTYGPILGWVPTECSFPDDAMGGITELRNALTAAIDSAHMDSARRKFPKKWHAIKSALEGMKVSFLDYQDYVKRCKELGESDPAEQAALASDLHDLGVALNYARDPRLHDTTVLRPDWLANGIYAVLRANDLDDKLPPNFNIALAPDAIITADSLKHIHEKAQAWGMLKPSDYPAEKRDFLLRLMDIFHLSYPLDDEGKTQLVPTLLPPSPPAKTDEPEGPERVQLRYEFQVVPAPLVPWFIARTFALIPNRLHWSRGAMLAFGDARAKVWATQDDRYVFATVVGPEHARRRMLAIIRGTLQRIFREYKALSPVEQWRHNGRWVPREALEEFGVLPREDFDRADENPLSEEAES